MFDFEEFKEKIYDFLKTPFGKFLAIANIAVTFVLFFIALALLAGGLFVLLYPPIAAAIGVGAVLAIGLPIVIIGAVGVLIFTVQVVGVLINAIRAGISWIKGKINASKSDIAYEENENFDLRNVEDNKSQAKVLKNFKNLGVALGKSNISFSDETPNDLKQEIDEQIRLMKEYKVGDDYPEKLFSLEKMNAVSNALDKIDSDDWKHLEDPEADFFEAKESFRDKIFKNEISSIEKLEGLNNLLPEYPSFESKLDLKKEKWGNCNLKDDLQKDIQKRIEHQIEVMNKYQKGVYPEDLLSTENLNKLGELLDKTTWIDEKIKGNFKTTRTQFDETFKKSGTGEKKPALEVTKPVNPGNAEQLINVIKDLKKVNELLDKYNKSIVKYDGDFKMPMSHLKTEFHIRKDKLIEKSIKVSNDDFKEIMTLTDRLTKNSVVGDVKDRIKLLEEKKIEVKEPEKKEEQKEKKWQEKGKDEINKKTEDKKI